MTTEVGDYVIQLTNPLGEGGFGRVYQGNHKTTGEKIAAKNILLTWRNRDYAKQEVEVLKLMKI